MCSLLSTLEEWQDLEPLENPPSSHAAVDIRHSDEYKDTFGLLYAAIAKSEMSERVLHLTERCIHLCPAHYTAWDYRFQCLEALDADMEQEWSVCLAIAEDNAKNYQIWNHRRRCAMRMGADNAVRELEFAEHFLDKDAKNYHIWAHRQALVKAFDLWTNELTLCDKLLERDVRNNSAWNQRAFLKQHALQSMLSSTLAESQLRTTSASGIAAQESAEEAEENALTVAVCNFMLDEVAYARNLLEKVPGNESAWNYMLGLVPISQRAAHTCLHSLLKPSLTSSHKHIQDGASSCGLSAVGTLDNPDCELQGSTSDDACDSLDVVLNAAVQAVYTAVFRCALQILVEHPRCVPAKVALMRQYLAGAAFLSHQGEDAAASKASTAATQLCEALIIADPLRQDWYRAIQTSLAP